MKQTHNFWVLGGDLRQSWLARLLAEDGHRVHSFAQEHAAPLPDTLSLSDSLDGLEQADCVVLPMPVCTGKALLSAPRSSLPPIPVSQILDRLAPHQLLCGGRVSPQCLAMAQERGLTLHDYFQREELAVANAVPTALPKGHIFSRTGKGPCPGP